MENIKIPTKLGHELSGFLFTPAGNLNRNKIIVLGSATGIQCTYYSKFAHYLMENKFSVLLFDYSGIGGSLYDSLRKINVNMVDWGTNDLQAVIDYVKQQKKYERVFYLGHSVGGQILGLLNDPNVFEKIILVASQNGYWRYYSRKKYFYALSYYTIWPLLTKIFGYLPSKRMIGENLPKGVARQWVQWLKSKNYLFDHIEAEGYNLLSRPLLAYAFTDDHYATPEASANLLSHYPNAEIELQAISPSEVNKKAVGHFGFFKEKNKDVFWPEVIKYFSIG